MKALSTLRKEVISINDADFARWVKTYGDTVYRVAYHAAGSHHDAEDVVQTVLLKLYQHETPFESDDHVKHWLLRVTVNESRRLLRAPWRRTVPLEDYDGVAPPPSESDGVLAAVMALEPKYRLSVYLYYYEGCSVGEIAQALHAKESTVQTWLYRARQKLRITLEKEGFHYV